MYNGTWSRRGVFCHVVAHVERHDNDGLDPVASTRSTRFGRRLLGLSWSSTSVGKRTTCSLGCRCSHAVRHRSGSLTRATASSRDCSTTSAFLDKSNAGSREFSVSWTTNRHSPWPIFAVTKSDHGRRGRWAQLPRPRTAQTCCLSPIGNADNNGLSHRRGNLFYLDRSSASFRDSGHVWLVSWI